MIDIQKVELAPTTIPASGQGVAITTSVPPGMMERRIYLLIQNISVQSICHGFIKLYRQRVLLASLPVAADNYQFISPPPLNGNATSFLIGGGTDYTNAIQLNMVSASAPDAGVFNAANFILQPMIFNEDCDQVSLELSPQGGIDIRAVLIVASLGQQ